MIDLYHAIEVGGPTLCVVLFAWSFARRGSPITPGMSRSERLRIYQSRAIFAVGLPAMFLAGCWFLVKLALALAE